MVFNKKAGQWIIFWVKNDRVALLDLVLLIVKWDVVWKDPEITGESFLQQMRASFWATLNKQIITCE